MNNKICEDFQEHPNWRHNQDKRVGVTWDAWCSFCGFKLENKPFVKGGFYGIEGIGRKLGHIIETRIIDEERFYSNKRKIACSICCPVLLKESDE